MEDSHVIFMRELWGFFGVFDGHGGSQCSTYIAKRLHEELEAGPPEDDAAMAALALRLDKEFLESGQPSGSTGTFVLVKPPDKVDGQYLLRVGNIGDSRVLLGRADGTIVEGPGTDSGLTTDHKPDYPSERERIERTGGSVQDVMGVARVNGDLAVSRAFGDAQHKETGGPAQEDHPVSAAPELLTIECAKSDFLMLVCDGISEGDHFPNKEVVKLAAERLRSGNKVDPGEAAVAVCREALRCGSKDNLSCMIVLLGGDEPAGPELDLLPGPFEAPEHAEYRKAYSEMAGHAGFSLAQSVEKRYDTVLEELRQKEQASADPEEDDRDVAGAATIGACKAELEPFGDGPPADLARGSAERTQWFADWCEEHSTGRENGPDGDTRASTSISREHFMQMLCSNPQLRQMVEQEGIRVSPAGESANRLVRVAPVSELKPAVEAHSALKWADQLEGACEKVGTVIRDDEDGTSQVRFAKPLNMVAWLPTSTLTDMEEGDDEEAETKRLRTE